MEALYQLSYGPNETCSRYPIEQLTDEAPADKRYIAIKALDLVEPARVVVENMNNPAAVVDKNPLLLRHALT